MGPKKKGLMALTKPELINKINDLQNQLKNFSRKENSFDADDVDDKLQNLSNINEKILTRLDSLETNIKLLQDENTGLKKSIKIMEEDTLNLTDDIFYLESDLSSLEQYSRRWNIEIQNIPDDVEQNLLAPSVTHALNQMDVNVTEYSIEAIHRLKKSKNNNSAPVIVRFKNRDDAYKTLKQKRKANKVDKSTFGQSMKTNIYIQENLCPRYKEIFDFCTSMKEDDIIYKVWTFKGVCNILFTDDINEKPTAVYHYDELWDLFPDD